MIFWLLPTSEQVFHKFWNFILVNCKPLGRTSVWKQKSYIRHWTSAKEKVNSLGTTIFKFDLELIDSFLNHCRGPKHGLLHLSTQLGGFDIDLFSKSCVSNFWFQGFAESYKVGQDTLLGSSKDSLWPIWCKAVAIWLGNFGSASRPGPAQCWCEGTTGNPWDRLVWPGGYLREASWGAGMWQRYQ